MKCGVCEEEIKKGEKYYRVLDRDCCEKCKKNAVHEFVNEEGLKKICFYGKEWYVDQKLKEIRNVECPHDSITFGEISNLYCDMLNEK